MIQRPANLSVFALADWLEAELLIGEHTSLSDAQLQGLLSDDLGGVDEWDETLLAVAADDAEEVEAAFDLAAEGVEVLEEDLAIVIAGARAEIERRRAIAGVRYPLEISGEIIKQRGPWTSYPEYTFLSMLSLRHDLGLAGLIDAAVPAKLFERLVVTALKYYLKGESRRFGWPLDPAIDGFEGTFVERATMLAQLLSEKPHSDMHTVNHDQKDYGLDVVAWRSFDNRGSQVVMLCQCGIGSDWADKALPPGRWPKVIEFLASPVLALAYPFYPDPTAQETKWAAVSADCGVLLDRLRVARYSRVDITPGLRTSIEEWIEAKKVVLSA